MRPDPEALSAAFASYAEATRRREVDRAFARLGGREALTDEQRRVVCELADAIASGIVAAPERTLEERPDERTVEAAARLLPVASDADGRDPAGRAGSD